MSLDNKEQDVPFEGERFIDKIKAFLKADLDAFKKRYFRHTSLPATEVPAGEKVLHVEEARESADELIAKMTELLAEKNGDKTNFVAAYMLDGPTILEFLVDQEGKQPWDADLYTDTRKLHALAKYWAKPVIQNHHSGSSLYIEHILSANERKQIHCFFSHHLKQISNMMTVYEAFGKYFETMDKYLTLHEKNAMYTSENTRK